MIGHACKTLQRLALLATLACLAVPAAAAPPPNDDFDDALPVGALPFQDTQDFSEATGASDDPYSTCGSYVAYTAWYSFTPSTDVLVDAYASYVSSVHVYTGSRGNLTQVACGGFQGTVRFQATTGTTYYILVSDAPYSAPPVWVTFSLQDFPAAAARERRDRERDRGSRVAVLGGHERTVGHCVQRRLRVRRLRDGHRLVLVHARAERPGGGDREQLDAFPERVGVHRRPRAGCGGLDGALRPPALRRRCRDDLLVMVAVNPPLRRGPLVSFAEAPPPFSLGVTADRGSVVLSTGQATLTGTVTCNERASVIVSGSLWQERAGKAIEGWFWTNVYCEGAGRVA
jgi:hypothetical protein